MAAKPTPFGPPPPALIPPTFPPPRRPPLSSSLAQSTQTPANLPPLSLSFANRLEELDFSGASLDYNPGPYEIFSSASHPGPLAPPNSLASQSLQAPPPDARFQIDGPKPAKIHVINPTLELALALIQNMNGKHASHCYRPVFDLCPGRG
jgi:hypothetical protein